MVCKCGQAEYRLERYRSGTEVGALGAWPTYATRWRCPKCDHTIDRLPGHDPNTVKLGEVVVERSEAPIGVFVSDGQIWVARIEPLQLSASAAEQFAELLKRAASLARVGS